MKVNKILIACGLVAFVMLWQISMELHDLATHVENIDNRLDAVEGLVNNRKMVDHTDKDIECLTRNIYYEAGTEKDIGKYAVAQVTINRVKSGYWGNTVCKVVHAPAQFSWTTLKRLPAPDPGLYRRCRSIARSALNGIGVQGLDRSLFYHTDYIKAPNWVDVRYRVGQIGSHIFYNRAKNSWLEL